MPRANGEADQNIQVLAENNRRVIGFCGTELQGYNMFITATFFFADRWIDLKMMISQFAEYQI